MIEMWQRQLEMRLFMPIAQVLRHSSSAHGGNGDAAGSRLGCGQSAKGAHAMAIVDKTLRDRPFIAGDRFTVADITGLVALDFAKPARIAIPPELVYLNRWHEALKKRPSAAA